MNFVQKIREKLSENYQTYFPDFIQNMAKLVLQFINNNVLAFGSSTLSFTAATLQVVYCAFFLIIFVFLGIFFFLLDHIGFHKLLNKFGSAFANNTSLVQMANPSLFSQPDISEHLQAVAKATDSAAYDNNVARGLLVLSSLVYENVEDIKKIALDWGWDVRNIDVEKNETKSKKSEKSVAVPLEKAKPNYLKPILSIFPSLLSPLKKKTQEPELETFAKIFSKVEEKELVLVVTFRGTSPKDLNEWLIDGNLILTDEAPELLKKGEGKVHWGFHERLFIRNPHTPIGSKKSSPIENVLSTIDAVVDGHSGGVRVWVTGHSLGAALATLFYLKLIRDPLKARKLVGCYTFGSPRVGDYDFVAAMTGKMEEKKLWRVVNALDIVPRVPLGWDNTDLPRRIKIGILDYVHLGTHVQTHYPVDKKKNKDSKFLSGIKKKIKYSKIIPYVHDYFYHWNFLNLLKTLAQGQFVAAIAWFITPFFIFDHTPGSYYKNLTENSRPEILEKKFLSEEQKKKN